MTQKEKAKDFVMTHPDADFIGYIKVGNRGVPEFYTDKSKYEARLDKVWDSGFDFTAEVIKGLHH